MFLLSKAERKKEFHNSRFGGGTANKQAVAHPLVWCDELSDSFFALSKTLSSLFLFKGACHDAIA